ncbi:UNKNOWN [Stylonychia lemnae]|uniref:Uncharacterized protein n=1 Tax=Stylonychia lemnae TaxID=5949 RepID=A0A078B6X7_STYLE|nr:UNKNOWN [Stylonychia lemnae]|eukprot:CDW90139.1 UNKNOWN [Stylonychia lemnae]
MKSSNKYLVKNQKGKKRFINKKALILQREILDFKELDLQTIEWSSSTSISKEMSRSSNSAIRNTRQSMSPASLKMFNPNKSPVRQDQSPQSTRIMFISRNNKNRQTQSQLWSKY